MCKWHSVGMLTPEDTIVIVRLADEVSYPFSVQPGGWQLFGGTPRYGKHTHTNAEYEEKTEEIRKQMTKREVVVTKDCIALLFSLGVVASMKQCLRDDLVLTVMKSWEFLLYYNWTDGSHILKFRLSIATCLFAAGCTRWSRTFVRLWGRYGRQ